MAYDDLEKLDLSKLTLSDVAGVKNESLKKVLASAVEHGSKIGTDSHQNHASHGDHSTAPPPKVY